MSQRCNGVRFLHCADLHLDSPFDGQRKVDAQIAGKLRDATFLAWKNVVDRAIEQRVDFILVAGDVFDAADRSLRAQLRFRGEIERAAEAGITSCIVHGNHDPLDGWQIELSLPDGSHRFVNTDRIEPFRIVRDGRELARVYGVSYATRETRENLALRFAREPDAPFAIGLLHANVGGNPAHDNYAPCSMEELAATGIDYWALGHVHERAVLHKQKPTIVYPGNTQGRSVRELGPRGCYLVEVAESRHVSLQFQETDVVRWFERSIDIRELEDFDQLLGAISDLKEQLRSEAAGRAAVVRLHLVGRGELHSALRTPQAQADLEEHFRSGEPEKTNFVWLESVHDATRPMIDVERRRCVEDFVGDFLRAAQRLRENESPADALREILSARPEHQRIAAHLDRLDDTALVSLLEEAETLGLDLLLDDAST